MKVSFLTSASVELDEAIQFYESQQNGLGIRFATAVETSLSRVQLFPEAHQLLGKYSRRCIMSKFPYGLIYQHRKSDRQILVVAVAHLHRLPDYWHYREPQS